jgi:hypothetical protein
MDAETRELLMLDLIVGGAYGLATPGRQSSAHAALANIPLCACGCRNERTKHVEMRAA